MGAACCVAARDRTITNGSSSDVMPRNIRYSPSWSNRRRVAGEETPMNWFSDGVGTNDRLDNKSQTTIGTTYASEEGSPLEGSDISLGRSPHLLKGMQLRNQAKESRESQLTSGPSPTKMSPPTRSISSFSPSPLSSSQPHLEPPSRLPTRSSKYHLLRQVSDSRVPPIKSPNFSISEEGSPFNDLMATSRRERWSFDSESVNFNRDKISRSRGRVSSSPSPSIDTQTCGICSKLLTEKSYWGTQKIIATNELAVVAILICGHVYHSECLENVTPEVNKYDPACPVCTFGEKQVFKFSEQALRNDMELRANINKKSRSVVVDRDINGDNIMFDEGGIPKMSSSSSMKTYSGKPFLKRHFSFGSKGSRSLSENNYSWKKGFFWAKSSKE